MGHWQKFTTVGNNDMRAEEDRLEITCALMMGARFITQPKTSQPWSCIDDELKADHTGWWMHKANAARAYLSIKGIFFTREGNPIAPVEKYDVLSYLQANKIPLPASPVAAAPPIATVRAGGKDNGSA